MKVKDKVLMAGCIIVAAVCMLYGFMIFSIGSGTAFFLIWIIIAVLFLGLGASIFLQIWRRISKMAARILLGIVLLGLVLFCVVECLIASQMYASGEKNLDYIIVLGAQVRENGPSTILKYRLDRAVEYLSENPNTICIVSGGQGDNEPFPEAEGMAEYLMKLNVKENRLILESESKTTEENVRNSMKFIKKGASVGIVTNDFHVFRAVQTAKREGLDHAEGIAAGSPVIYLPNNMLREFFAEIKFFLGSDPTLGSR